VTIGVKYRGPSGTLRDFVEGPVYLANILGLRGVPFSTFLRESSVVDGQTVTGWKANARPVTLALDIIGSSPTSWEVLESEVLSDFRPDAYGTLFVTGPVGRTRQIDIRLDESEDQGDEADPSEENASRVVLPCIADQPYYRGRRRIISFPAATLNRKTYPGPPFYFPNASSDGETTVYNEGDVDSHGVWTFPGPLNAFEIEVAGGVVSGEIEVAERSTLTLNTSPLAESLVLTTEEGETQVVTESLNSVDFRAIPHGGSSRIRVRSFGAGTPSVSFSPLYFRAW
jgi:hypothetical protein